VTDPPHPGAHSYDVTRLDFDPRKHLEAGVYKATVLGVVRDPELQGGRYVEKLLYRVEARSCRGWVYHLKDADTDQEFLQASADRGWFDFSVTLPGGGHP
jgi:hypothetical protein